MSEVFPEKPGDDAGKVVFAGLEMHLRLPQGAIPVSALVCLRCLLPDDEGPGMLWWSATEGLPTWEIEGFTRFVQHGVRADWDQYMFGADSEEGEEGSA